MLAFQLEGKLIVIETTTITIDTVMAFQTMIAEGHLMLHHEIHIDADMAFGTRQHIELCDVFAVTIST